MSGEEPEIQVIVPLAVQGRLREWLGQQGWYLFLIPGLAGDLPTYGIGPAGQPAREGQPPPLPVPRYEARVGIRPRSERRGKVRGIVCEVADGGSVEWWSCRHDHAAGVRDVRDIDAVSREEALQCAEGWLADRIAEGSVDEFPVIRGDS